MKTGMRKVRWPKAMMRRAYQCAGEFSSASSREGLLRARKVMQDRRRRELLWSWLTLAVLIAGWDQGSRADEQFPAARADRPLELRGDRAALPRLRNATLGECAG